MSVRDTERIADGVEIGEHGTDAAAATRRRRRESFEEPKTAAAAKGTAG